jgi:hypothetical protein
VHSIFIHRTENKYIFLQLARTTTSCGELSMHMGHKICLSAHATPLSLCCQALVLAALPKSSKGILLSAFLIFVLKPAQIAVSKSIISTYYYFIHHALFPMGADTTCPEHSSGNPKGMTGCICDQGFVGTIEWKNNQFVGECIGQS